MHMLLKFLGTAAVVFLTINIVSGISVEGGWVTILLVALVWSGVSLVIKPIIHILALPITILTFGLFALIINAFLFWLVSVIVPGFTVGGPVAALLGSIVLSILTWLIHSVIKPAHGV
ncbi:phage holin family protein [Candidatus Parcubacteria bacterium]|nr:MAG: phage holin family protein [Candidatus Parcubacteria bacterium]